MFDYTNNKKQLDFVSLRKNKNLYNDLKSTFRGFEIWKTKQKFNFLKLLKIKKHLKKKKNQRNF